MQVYPLPQNLLLRSLMRAKAPVPADKLQHVAFESGQTLWEVGDSDPFAIFPLRGAISLQLSPGDGKQVEVAIVGREGFAGVSLLPGAETNWTAAVAISAGEALVMPREVLRRAAAVPRFRAALDRYSQLHLVTLSYTVVCNRVHVIEKVCVGRLLQLHDRLRVDSLSLTQDTFARQLGVRRASISRAIAGLQRRGLLSYDRRGRMTILDRNQLERLACPCYHHVKSEFDRHVAQHGGL